MSNAKPKCNRMDCFQNKCGVRCELLTDHPSVQPCPFYKTEEQVEIGRQEAHAKLVKKGRRDLIQLYEYNPFRKW